MEREVALTPPPPLLAAWSTAVGETVPNEGWLKAGDVVLVIPRLTLGVGVGGWHAVSFGVAVVRILSDGVKLHLLQWVRFCCQHRLLLGGA